MFTEGSNTAEPNDIFHSEANSRGKRRCSGEEVGGVSGVSTLESEHNFAAKRARSISDADSECTSLWGFFLCRHWTFIEP